MVVINKYALTNTANAAKQAPLVKPAVDPEMNDLAQMRAAATAPGAALAATKPQVSATASTPVPPTQPAAAAPADDFDHLASIRVKQADPQGPTNISTPLAPKPVAQPAPSPTPVAPAAAPQTQVAPKPAVQTDDLSALAQIRAAQPAPAAMNFAPPPINQPPVINPGTLTPEKPAPAPAPSTPIGAAPPASAANVTPQTPQAPYVPPSAPQTGPPASTPAYDAAIQAKAQAAADAATAAKAPAPNSSTPDMDALAAFRAEQTKAREAEVQQLGIDKATALQNAAASSGLGGMGLSGASAALQSNIRSSQDRNAALTLSQFDNNQQTQDFNQLQRQAAIWDLEQSENADLDGDGHKGPPGQDPNNSNAKNIRTDSGQMVSVRDQQDAVDGLKTDKHSELNGVFGASGPVGGVSNPYTITATQLRSITSDSGVNMVKSTYTGGDGRSHTVYKAPDGSYFYVEPAQGST